MDKGLVNRRIKKPVGDGIHTVEGHPIKTSEIFLRHAGPARGFHLGINVGARTPLRFALFKVANKPRVQRARLHHHGHFVVFGQAVITPIVRRNKSDGIVHKDHFLVAHHGLRILPDANACCRETIDVIQIVIVLHAGVPVAGVHDHLHIHPPRAGCDQVIHPRVRGRIGILPIVAGLIEHETQ